MLNALVNISPDQVITKLFEIVVVTSVVIALGRYLWSVITDRE